MKSHRFTDLPGEEESSSENQVRIPEDADRVFMGRIYNWMAGGLVITGLTAWKISAMMLDPASIFNRSPGIFLILLILEIILVGALSALIQKISPLLAALLFCFFAVMNGMSLAPLFLFYTSASIASAFFACAGMFFVTSLFGYMTKIDLGRAGAFCVMGVFGLIIATLINLFLNNSLMETIICYVGIILFLGLTAWDTQRLRLMMENLASDGVSEEDTKKYAIVGALALYLDFINIFLFLLRLTGKRD